MANQQNGANGISSSQSEKKPVILFVTGSWHVPEHYAPLTTLLQSYGFEVHCPLLPSNASRTPPAGIDDDILFIREKALHLLAHSSISILCHSYGGIVSSYAFAGPSFPPTTTTSAPTRVPHTTTTLPSPSIPSTHRILNLIYLTAFIPLPSESLMGIFGSVPPFLYPNPSNRNLEMRPGVLETHFYNACHPLQQRRAKELLVPQMVAANFDAPAVPHSRLRGEVLAAFGLDANGSGQEVAELPPVGTETPNPLLKGLKMAYDREGTAVSYVYCTADAGIPLEVQKMMSGRMAGRGVKVREAVVEGADHSAFYCRPGETAGVVVGLLGG